MLFTRVVPQLSSAVGAANVTTAPCSSLKSTVTGAGQVTMGGVSSNTMTFALQSLDDLPSLTVSCTLVVPSGNGPLGFKLIVIGSLSGSDDPLLTSAASTAALHDAPALFIASWHLATGGRFVGRPRAKGENEVVSPHTTLFDRSKRSVMFSQAFVAEL